MGIDSGDRVRASPAESDRFGLRIARWIPGDPDDVETIDPEVLDQFDVVIVRRPAAWADRWSDVLRFERFEAVHADTLVYWSWRDEHGPLPAPSGNVLRHAGADGIASLVRDVFDRYQNHYAANPLLDRSRSVEGYVEWAVSVAEEHGHLRVDDDRGPVGFGLVDWSAGPPDVRLAGVCGRSRGAGRYRDVVLTMMHEARSRGERELWISTQVQNIAVQRTWSGLGWRPFSAFDTTHLISSRVFSSRSSGR